MNRLLALLVTHHRYMDFGLSQLQSLLEMAQWSNKINTEIRDHADFPHVVLQANNIQEHKQGIATILSRAILTKKMMHLVGEAASYQQLVSSWQLEPFNHIFSDQNAKIKVDFHTHNAHVAKEQQIHRINNTLEMAKYKGSIDLANPNHTFSLVESYNPDKSLKKVYFGLDVSNNRIGRQNAKKYALSQRYYHGPTSTDTELAFIMCHQAQVKEYQWVCDPFVGTGSLLIPPAHYKAMTFGSDIDWRVLQGTAVGRVNKKCAFAFNRSKIVGNFDQFGLIPPNLIRMDCLKSWYAHGNLFDAIICDPPYGLRAMSRTSSNEHRDSPEWKHQNFRKMDLADRQHIYSGLFQFSERHLRPGGRLVCLYPIFFWQSSDMLPQHPSFKLVSSSRNQITAGNQRVLLTYHKY